MQDADVRLVRRIRRDTVERGRDVNSVLEQVTLLLLLICNPSLFRNSILRKILKFGKKRQGIMPDLWLH